MKPPQNKYRLCLPRLLLVGLVAAFLLVSEVRAWEVVNYQDRDYVTLASLADFYGFRHEVNDKHLWLRGGNFVIKGVANSRDLFINQIKFVLSYPILPKGRDHLVSRLDLCKLIDPVIRPHFIKDASPFTTVVVDPGHGGEDPGSKGVYGHEKEYTLRLARQLRERLEGEGFKVVMTRDEDKYLSLPERMGIANRIENSIFISLHFNYGSKGISGIETFALSPDATRSPKERSRDPEQETLQGNQLDAENIALATAVHVSVIKKLRAVDRGIKRASWAVLKWSEKPAILFEGGFITDKEESRKIADVRHRERLASAITDAIVNFRDALTLR